MSAFTFRALRCDDLPMLHEWLQRPQCFESVVKSGVPQDASSAAPPSADEAPSFAGASVVAPSETPASALPPPSPSSNEVHWKAIAARARATANEHRRMKDVYLRTARR